MVSKGISQPIGFFTDWADIFGWRIGFATFMSAHQYFLPFFILSQHLTQCPFLLDSP